MKILKRGNTCPVWVGYKANCTCGTKFQLERDDKVRFEADWRDGDVYVVKCPVCSADLWIDARLFKRRLTP